MAPAMECREFADESLCWAKQPDQNGNRQFFFKWPMLGCSLPQNWKAAESTDVLVSVEPLWDQVELVFSCGNCLTPS
jgi:hypothetical protein